MRFLSILEVSQKQAYIFSSNRLRDNVANSANIAWVTSSDYFQSIGASYQEAENLVYAGGGHTVSQFHSQEEAETFHRQVTRSVLQQFPDMEVFAKCMMYDEKKAPKDNLKELIRELELKKAERKVAFRQGSFGIEEIDPNTRQPKRVAADVNSIPKSQEVVDRELLPEGFENAYQFEELGGSRDESNFIAVIHIDGNGMGKRVKEFQDKEGSEGKTWDEFRKRLREFSEAIDYDFKTAYKETANEIAHKIEDNSLDVLSLHDKKFPMRRIITSGDDICFVTEGRIGIECARVFIQNLNRQKNSVDGKGYAACAGVAIVHTKYPFYRAYELAEALCGNAKSFGAGLSPMDNGASVSAIDWHIDFGEMGDQLGSIRDQYLTEEDKHLEMRPYIVSALEEILKKEPVRHYRHFKKVLKRITDEKDSYARSSIKELRSILREKEKDVWYYLTYHKIESLAMECYQGIFRDMQTEKLLTGEKIERKLFLKTEDGKERSLLFDAVEVMDTFIDLGGEER